MSLLRQLIGSPRTRRDFGSSAGEKIPERVVMSAAGVPVTEETALRYTTVFRCVSLIADTVSQLPRGVFLGEGGARRPVPDPAWLTRPSGEDLWLPWMGSLTVSLLLRGNAYALAVERDAAGHATQLETLHPDEVRVHRVGGKVIYDVVGEGKLSRYPLGDVLHVKGMTLPGRRSLTGLSPISYAAQTIGTAIAAQDYGARTYVESAVPPGALVTASDMDDAEVKRLKREWQKAHANRSREIAVLAGGVDFKQLGLSPEDAQFLEAIRAHDRQIAGFFGVPLHMVGLGDMQSNWGTGLEENNLQFITYSLGIHMSRFEEVFATMLASPRYFRFNVAGLLRGRLKDRYAAYITGRQGGWLSIDDIRALEDQPPLADGKGADYLMPLNYSAIPPGGAVVDEPAPAVVTVPGASAS